MIRNMYILNTSFMVDYDIHALWFRMIRERFLPYLKARGFEEFVFTKVLSDGNEGHFTYSLQVPMADLARYREYNEEIMGEYREIAGPAFGEKALYFCSVLKRVEF